MRIFRIVCKPIIIAVLGFATSALAQEPEVAPVVMLVGVYHFANPGLDVVNIEADDVRSSERQREIAALTERLAQFRPTAIAVEEVSSSPDFASPTFSAWQAGQRSDSRNERDQIAFRLAKQTGARVAAVDVDMPLNFGPLIEAAQIEAPGVLARVMSTVQVDADATSSALKSGTISDALAALNSADALGRGESLYYIPLAASPDGGATLPGVEIAATWYERNLRICAKLMALAEPGQRILVIYGASHVPQLAQCLAGAGIRLDSPLPYLTEGQD